MQSYDNVFVFCIQMYSHNSELMYRDVDQKVDFHQKYRAWRGVRDDLQEDLTNRQHELLVNEDLGQNVICLAALASNKVPVPDDSGRSIPCLSGFSTRGIHVWKISSSQGTYLNYRLMKDMETCRTQACQHQR